MAKCKYCHETISKLDKDICPFCGGLKPLEGLADYTEDFTKAFDPIKMDDSLDIDTKKKKTASIFGFTLGFFGGHYFYLGFKQKAIIQLLINLILVILPLLLVILLKAPTAALIVTIILLVVLLVTTNVYFGLRYHLHNDLKDANGDLLR